MTRLEDTPAQPGRTVVARFRGTGTARILLLAHMDTVYERGTVGAAAVPRRGRSRLRPRHRRRQERRGAGDARGGGAAARSTSATTACSRVAINGDEEISSPGSRSLITRLGSEHDAVFSCEGSDASDSLRLATSGNGAALLRVKGRSSHAGSAPGDGRNALYELSHQILQMRDLSDPETGATLNWTVARAGAARNIIPAVGRGHRRRARAAGARLGHAGSAAARAHQEPADCRHAGERGARTAAPAARSDAGVAGDGGARGARLRDARPPPARARPLRRGRHRRRVRGAQDRGARGGGLRPHRRRRALRRARVDRPPQRRAADVSAGADDRRRGAGEDRTRCRARSAA